MFSFSGSHTNTNSVTVVATPNSQLTAVMLEAMVFLPYILKIEIDEVMAAQIRAQSDYKTSAATPNFDVRLYDASGILVRNTQTKGGKVTFNVSSLHSGFYYLHVYDEIIPSPEVLKIIIN